MDLFRLRIQVLKETEEEEDRKKDEGGEEDEEREEEGGRKEDRKVILDSEEIDQRIPEESIYQSENQYNCDLDTITLDQVAFHDTVDDCWVVIYDYVYDCTEFLKIHPGGQDILMEYAGRDATLAFIGTGHSKNAQNLLSRYLIGELPVDERIFRKLGGIRIA